MDTAKLKAFCERLPGASTLRHADPKNVLVYRVGDKTFAYFKTSQPEQWRFSVRVSPDRFLELTGIPGIRPARYMGRFHWVTIVDVGSVPDDYLAELVACSHARALASMSGAARAKMFATAGANASV